MERFPLLIDAPLLETRSCHYELSVTRNFYIDTHPEWSNVYDKVEITLLRVAERPLRVNDPDLAAVLADEAHLRNADELVDASLVAFRRPPIELARDRH